MRTGKKRKNREGEEGASVVRYDSIPAIDKKNFYSAIEKQKFDSDFQRRKVNPGRNFDFKFLAQIGFPYLQDFESWGWMPMLSLKRKIYTYLVKVFYFNGVNKSYDHEENNTDYNNNDVEQKLARFETYVLGTHMEMTRYVLQRAIGESIRGCDYPDDYDVVGACRVIFRNPNLTQACFDTKDLSLHNRILHLIVTQSLNPRAGNFTRMSKEDVWWMHKIIIRDPPDLVGWMISHMQFAIKANKNETSTLGLPYGQVISEVLDDGGLGLELREEILEDALCQDFTKKSLKQMGYVFDQERKEWIKGRNVEKNDIVEKALVEDDEGRPSSSNINAAIFKKLEGLEVLMRNMNEAIGTMQEKMKEFGNRMTRLEDHLGIPSISQEPL